MLYQKKEAISVSLNNKLIERVYVGAERENDGPITKGFVGCLEVFKGLKIEVRDLHQDVSSFRCSNFEHM